MLVIKDFAVNGLKKGYVTDEKDIAFTWSCESDRQGAYIRDAVIRVNGESITGFPQTGALYDGRKLAPRTEYEAVLTLEDDLGEKAESKVSFETGLMNSSWTGIFITDGAYEFKEKKISPKPMVFRKRWSVSWEKKIDRVKIYATALGIYELEVNGKKAGERYFAPGFTSYASNLQYQTYDISGMTEPENEVIFTVAGGWAVGEFIYSRKNRNSGERQALLAEIYIRYEDGSEEIIGTDETWEVSVEGPLRSASIYDGEEYDATIELKDIAFHTASVEKLRISPSIYAEIGAPVVAHEHMTPVSKTRYKDEIIYDFGQNFAGVVCISVDGFKGQEITVRHAEILNRDGSLNTEFLRSAKAAIRYICREGHQEYSPRFTYMGFRYVSVKGIDEDRIDIFALALYSDMEVNGSFSCSDERINRLQKNIEWGARSNLFDIPTDCPQRDERMGWTGDIALFAPTAAYIFHMGRFFRKWLKDMRAEQRSTGGIPNTVPSNGFGFPVTMPVLAVDFWGDASVLVPWAEYISRGDIRILEENYEMMKKYVNACIFWAHLFSFGRRRYIWNTPSTLHFGDWVAPDRPKMSQWQKRSKWTATASLANTSHILSEIATITGHEDDAKYYRKVYEKTSEAYEKESTDGHGRLKEEFQTAYVLPIHFHMFKEENRLKAAENLAKLVKENDYRIGTGFPGTPYILFSLFDNGQREAAFKMLCNEKCPSWLYEVRMGATTIWERWDGLDEEGNCPISDDGTDAMVSYNHYASGAVGDFLYRRIAGIEPVSPGYREFKIEPVPGGGISSARACLNTPYGEIVSDWNMEAKDFEISVSVPMGTKCTLIMPDGEKKELNNGKYRFGTKLGA